MEVSAIQQIGIIGSGNIGGTLARLFSEAGVTVHLSNSRGPESLQPLIQTLGKNVQAFTTEQVLRQNAVVVLSVPWVKRASLPDMSLFENKIVIDAMNPYTENYEIQNFNNSSSSEKVAEMLPGAHIVKAFNTIYYKNLATKGKPDAHAEERLPIFIAGDDQKAKEVVMGLVELIGFTPLDTGTLHSGGKLQAPNAPFYTDNISVQEARQKLLAHTA